MSLKTFVKIKIWHYMNGDSLSNDHDFLFFYFFIVDFKNSLEMNYNSLDTNKYNPVFVEKWKNKCNPVVVRKAIKSHTFNFQLFSWQANKI